MSQTNYTKRTSEARIKQVLAASLLRAKGLSQVTISERMGIPQTKVCRLLSDARSRRWLIQGKDRFEGHKVDPEYQHLVGAAEAEYVETPGLLEHIRTWLPPEKRGQRGLLEVKTCEDGDAFAASAAEALKPLLERASLVGVMFGRTLSTVIQELVVDRRHPDKRCIPVAGDPVYIMTQPEEGYSASRLAADLEERLTGGHTAEPSLTGVPAYIARRFLRPASGARGKTETPPILEFVNSIPGNTRIFGRPHLSGRKPLIKQVDLLLTGIGIIQEDAETGTFIRERLEQETGLDEDDLRGMIYGDIAGLLLPRRKGAERRVEELNRGWTGLQFDDMERISKKAARGPAPGVVVLAEAPEKAEVIKAAISQKGSINTLIASHSLCTALKKL